MRANSSQSDSVQNLDRLVEALGKEINLNASTRDVDELLASLDPAEWHPDARREVLVNYLGFPFWDVLTFTVTTGRDTCMIPLKIRRLFCGFGPGRFNGIKRLDLRPLLIIQPNQVRSHGCPPDSPGQPLESQQG